MLPSTISMWLRNHTTSSHTQSFIFLLPVLWLQGLDHSNVKDALLGLYRNCHAKDFGSIQICFNCCFLPSSLPDPVTNLHGACILLFKLTYSFIFKKFLVRWRAMWVPQWGYTNWSKQGKKPVKKLFWRRIYHFQYISTLIHWNSIWSESTHTPSGQCLGQTHPWGEWTKNMMDYIATRLLLDCTLPAWIRHWEIAI